jgi:integrase
LTHLGITKLTKVGMHADGGNLYLNVAAGGSKSWIFRYYRGGRQREMGLGSLLVVDLARAREEARRLREQLARDLDPIEEREREKAEKLAKQAEAESFSKTWSWCCETYVTTVKGPELTNPKHRAQWLSTLQAYTFERLGAMAVSQIGVNEVHSVLAPVWLEVNETANRVRQRMEAVLGWAKTKGYRSGDNPAAWRGLLEHMLAKPAKVQEERHHPSLPYVRAGEFMRALRPRGGVAPRALAFLVLTAQRTNPIITMEWGEVDWEHRIWMSPAEKMKGPYPHRTPLSRQALKLLREMEAVRSGPFVFQHGGEGLSNAAMNMVINKGLASHTPAFVDPNQGGRRVTPHGFRSTFRDWVADRTETPHDLAELAIAHVKGDKTVQAYLRTDMLEKRRPLMQAWADFCSPEKDPAEAG